MRRREFCVLLSGSGALLLPGVSRAQQAGRVYRIGYLSLGSMDPALLEVLRQRLRELGWVEGKNISFEFRFSDGRYELLPALAAELVESKVDVIAASPTPAALAAKDATQSIPIVGISLDNPVRHGLVASLARPGGNVTGVTYGDGPEIFGKDLGFLREVVPGLRRLAVLSNSTGLNHGPMMDILEPAARSFGIELKLFDVQAPENFDSAFDEMTKAAAEALFVFGDPMFGVHRKRVAELGVQHRLPTMYTNRPHVEAGGLMSYAASFPDIWQRAANYIDHILKGVKPADLPVEQPTKFELVINLKTANVLGLTVPPALLARADEVIE
jgi:putative ABC transport system substrate-binding protein